MEKQADSRGRSPLSGARPKGKKGKSGRPSNGWLDFTAALRGDLSVRKAIKQAASDPESRGFKAAIDLLAKYDPELPGRKVQLDANLTVRGVIALPVMQVPQAPAMGDRVIEGEVQGYEPRAPEVPSRLDMRSAFAGLLAPPR